MSVKRFKAGERVEFVAGNGKTYVGKFVRVFYPAPKAGPHYRIELEGAGGVVATVFANGVVGKSVRKVGA
jgi:hypothetical protein